MVYDLNDCFWVLPGGASASGLIRIRASDFYVDTPTLSGASPGTRTNGWMNSIQYVPALRGIVCAIKHGEDMIYLRTAA
jgi:hypothetical protein